MSETHDIVTHAIIGWGQRNGFPHVVLYDADLHKMTKVQAWLAAEAAAGDYQTWTFTEQQSSVLFRDPDLAFEFKMKFG